MNYELNKIDRESIQINTKENSTSYLDKSLHDWKSKKLYISPLAGIIVIIELKQCVYFSCKSINSLMPWIRRSDDDNKFLSHFHYKYGNIE